MKIFIHRVSQIKISHQVLKVIGQGDIMNITIELQDAKGNNYELDLFPTEDYTISIDQEVSSHATSSIDG